MATNRSISAPTTVVVLEPNANTRFHFKQILESANDFKLAGDFSHAHEAMNHISRLRPNLLLLGFRKQYADGIKYIRLLKRVLISLKIVVVLGAGDLDLLESALWAGADSCLVKPVRAAQCMATLRFATRGPTEIETEPLHPEPKQFSEEDQRRCELLSGSEREVMRCLAEGLLYKEIPDRLGISYSAVRKRQQKIYRKFHVANRSEAIGMWLRGSPPTQFHLNLPYAGTPMSASPMPSVQSTNRL